VTADTRQRLLLSAMALFAERGYGVASVAEILRGADANSGSLYHFFPTKQDLLLGVLGLYRDGIYPMLLEPAWRGVEDPIRRIFALLARYRRMLEESEFMYGCPIGNLALEIHEPDPPVRELLATNFAGWVAAVERCLVEAGDRLPEAVDRHALATFILTTMEGGVMQSRTHRSLQPFDAGVRCLEDYIRRLEEEAGSSAVTRRGTSR
jgi:AcrR family transcriptional regulator